MLYTCLFYCSVPDACEGRATGTIGVWDWGIGGEVLDGDGEPWVEC